MLNPLAQSRKSWTPNAWRQLKNLTKAEFIGLLKKDENWLFDHTSGAEHVFCNPCLKAPADRVCIHYHPREGFRNPSLLKHLLDQVCWTEQSLRERKVIR